jgi:nicotinamidase-related amidase
MSTQIVSPNSTQNQQSPFHSVWKHHEVALTLIDYQPEMFSAVKSNPGPELIELNTLFLLRVAKAFDIPVVLSTVGVASGVNGPMVKRLSDELPNASIIDRTSMNAWDDENFRSAIAATGRKRIVIGALWTEICLVYPIISMMGAGYEAMFVADAVGGQSQNAHDMGIARLIQAGAIPNTARATTDEWFRDWKDPLAARFRLISSWYKDERAKLSD